MLTDSAYPLAAKHLVFAFKTADLHDLLNFEYSLITDKGELLKFANGEDKIPALDFTIQVKKKIHKTNLKKNQDNKILKNQNDLRNSIKNLFISNQTKKKTIDEYAQLTTKIREEYAKLQQENNQLKIELHKYKNYVEQLPQKSYHKSYAHYQKKEKESIITI